MKLFRSTKKSTDKTKIGQNEAGLEVVEAVLVRCKLADNQYQQKSEVLYTFTPNKSWFVKFWTKQFSVFKNLWYWVWWNYIIFTVQKSRTLEIEDKGNLTLLINKYRNDAIFYRTKKNQIC